MIINKLPGESFTEIGHSLLKLWKSQNIYFFAYNGATFLMGNLEIENVTSFSHNFGFGWDMNVKFLPLWIFVDVEIFSANYIAFVRFQLLSEIHTWSMRSWTTYGRR